MPLPNIELLHGYADAVLQVIRKCNEFGVAVETAVQAFHDKYFEKHDPAVRGVAHSTGAYEQLPPEGRAIVDNALSGSTQS